MSNRLLKVRPSLYISAGLAVAVGLWLWSGQWVNAEENSTQAPSTEQQDEVVALQSVRTATSQAQLHQAVLKISGRTAYEKQVQVNAEIDGRIAQVDMEESHAVKKGQVIARVAIEDRQARVAEAQALLTQRKIEYDAANKLAKKGFQSEIRRSEAAANLQSAKAQLRQAQIALNNTAITSPLDGRVRTQSVEVGDYVKGGDPIATLVDMNPILVKGQVSERDINEIALGSQAEVTLITGQALQGIISRIAPVAEEATRTFEVAVEVENPGNVIPVGITAEMKLPLQQVKAHILSPSLLTLNDAGEIGVKYVDDDSVARFTPVSIIEDTLKGMWVMGLPDMVNLIVVGQEYVKDGQKVKTADVAVNG